MISLSQSSNGGWPSTSSIPSMTFTAITDLRH
nr:MAG TPA: hypothetical protein [Caudoviricetes sp.]